MLLVDKITHIANLKRRRSDGVISKRAIRSLQYVEFHRECCIRVG